MCGDQRPTALRKISAARCRYLGIPCTHRGSLWGRRIPASLSSGVATPASAPFSVKKTSIDGITDAQGDDLDELQYEGLYEKVGLPGLGNRRVYGAGRSCQAPCHVRATGRPVTLGLAKEIILVAQHEAELEASTTWRETFGGGELQNGRRLLLSGFVVGLLQQITGVNAIVYYAPVVFQDAGLSPRMSFILGGVGSIAMLVGTLLPILWIERSGRRKTLLASAWLEVFTMGGIAASIGYGINHPEHRESAGWAATAFILAFEFSFGLGQVYNCCPIPFVYAPEVNSLRSRHRGNAVQSMGLWAGCFLIVMVSPVGVANLSWRFYLIWMIITLAWIPMVWALMPETAGRSLEQMDFFFKKYQNKWYVRGVAYEWVERDEVMLDQDDVKDEALELENSGKAVGATVDEVV